MSNTTLHIPIDRTVRDKLAHRAKELGFDSVQAYVRVWAKAEAEGRTVDFGDTWNSPSFEAARRLDELAQQAKADSKDGKLPHFSNTSEMMEYLDRGEED